MKIHSLSNYNINNTVVPFTALNTTKDKKVYGNTVNEPQKPKHNDNGLPNWFRKTALFTLVFFAFKNDPYVQNIINPYVPTQEELDKDKFVRNYGKLIKKDSVSGAFYHLSKLNDFEQPKVKSLGENSYSLEFNLDKQKLIMEMNLDKDNKDTIRGRVKLGDRDFVKYAAVFSNDNKDEFKILIKDKNAKYVFGRDLFGELYQVRNGKKVILNKKNVERYRDYKEMLEDLDKFSFITDNNNLWRKLNLILLIYLLINEMAYDALRKSDDEVKSIIDDIASASDKNKTEPEDDINKTQKNDNEEDTKDN